MIKSINTNNGEYLIYNGTEHVANLIKSSSSTVGWTLFMKGTIGSQKTFTTKSAALEFLKSN